MMTKFDVAVYELIKMVPSGMVTTYQEVALRLGNRAYRAVGTSLSKNPYAPKVPCHRVVKSDGRVGGYGGLKESEKKIEMLRNEGIEIEDGRIKDFERRLYKFGN